MTGYEFMRFEADSPYQYKAQEYNREKVAQQVLLSRDGDILRDKDGYQDAKEWFLEKIMDCEKWEAIEWMTYYMVNAIAYGLQTKDLGWKEKFLAA